MNIQAIRALYEEGDTLVYIDYDSDPQSPREWGNASTIWCWGSRYRLGDLKDRPKEPVTLDELREDPDILACGWVVLYDHSGISISLTSGDPTFLCVWDSGRVGVAFVRKSDMLEAGFDPSDCTPEKAQEILSSDMEDYDQYVQGRVYAYRVRVGGGPFKQEVGGYMGPTYMRSILIDALGEERAARAQGLPLKIEAEADALIRTRAAYEATPREVIVRTPDWGWRGQYTERVFESIREAREYLESWSRDRAWQDNMIEIKGEGAEDE